MPGSARQGAVPVGAGSYTTRLPAGAKEPATAPYVTAAVKRPVPTNDWWSSLVFTRFSNQMFPHPLALQAHAEGLRLYDPGVGYTAGAGGIFTAVKNAPQDLTIGNAAEPLFNEARVAHWSDWFVTAAFGERLSLTFGHGSPFVYGTIQGADPTFTFATAPAVFSGDARSAVLGVRVGGSHYALFGPTGCTWEGLGTARLTCQTRGKPYFSVALLPDEKPETLALFARYAHNHVTDTRVEWSYDEKTSRLTVRYAFTIKAQEGSTKGTLYCLYPHQYQRSTDPLTAHTYRSVRGILKLGAGEGFTTVTPFSGVLPLLPALGGDPAQLKKYLAADADSYRPAVADTYWTGKALGKLATLAALADASGETGARETFRTRLKGLLERYFTATEEGPGCFYYNQPWGTLIGYPASYGSDEALNDHHFHYGYFLRAAAEVVRREPEWGKPSQWGGMVNLLIRDCANPERDDPQFPFLRNFDVYAGHSWADGKGDFADGNNNESSSEAMNAWTGLLLWGALTGDRKLRDTGIYLAVTEKDAIENYWFDRDQLYPKSFTPPMVSMVWGAKAVYATWFSGDPVAMHGINYLPFQSGSLYLGTNPELVRRNVAGLLRERAVRERGKPNRGAWWDIVAMYQALADPEAALASLNGETQELEAGNSRANLYHWLHFLERVGQVDASVTADTPFYTVFRKSKTRTYVVYSLTGRPVAFSDGMRIVPGKAGLTLAVRTR